MYLISLWAWPNTTGDDRHVLQPMLIINSLALRFHFCAAAFVPYMLFLSLAHFHRCSSRSIAPSQMQCRAGAQNKARDTTMTMNPGQYAPEADGEMAILNASMGAVAANHSSVPEFLNCLATHRRWCLDHLPMSIHIAFGGVLPVFSENRNLAAHIRAVVNARASATFFGPSDHPEMSSHTTRYEQSGVSDGIRCSASGNSCTVFSSCRCSYWPSAPGTNSSVVRRRSSAKQSPGDGS